LRIPVSAGVGLGSFPFTPRIYYESIRSVNEKLRSSIQQGGGGAVGEQIHVAGFVKQQLRGI
jgi:hypothetical protein